MSELSAEERERILDDAADRYMRGAMSVEDFERIQEHYAIDYGAALCSLAAYLVKRTKGRSGHG